VGGSPGSPGSPPRRFPGHRIPGQRGGTGRPPRVAKAECASPNDCVVPFLCALCVNGQGPSCDQATCINGQCGILSACSLNTCTSAANCTVPQKVCADCVQNRVPFCTQTSCTNGLCEVIEPCSLLATSEEEEI